MASVTIRKIDKLIVFLLILLLNGKAGKIKIEATMIIRSIKPSNINQYDKVDRYGATKVEYNGSITAINNQTRYHNGNNTIALTG